MNPSDKIYCELRITLPASFDAVEDFFVQFRKRSQVMLNHPDCFAAELLVREALTNAVVHGCNTDPCMHVQCILRLKRRRLLIAIKDDGEGFDWRAAVAHSAALYDTSGRGLDILHKYGNHVRYNEQGNEVTIVKRLY